MEADERILNELERLRQLFSDMNKHVSDLRKNSSMESGLLDEKKKEFEQLNGRVAGLLEQITRYADVLKDILGYKPQIEDLMNKIHKIDDYEQRRDELETNFQALSEKINGRIELTENKLLDFEVSCEEDLLSMSDKLSATKEARTNMAEQIQGLEEQRVALEDNLNNDTVNVAELENRLHKTEDSQIVQKIEKIDTFMAQKTAIQNLLLQNTQAIDGQLSEARNVQEMIQPIEDHLQTIIDRSDKLDAFMADTKKEYDQIREMIDKATDDFDQYVDSQSERIQTIKGDFNQTLKSFEEEYRKQIKAMAADEMDQIKTEFKGYENDAIEQMSQTKYELMDYLESGKEKLSDQTESGIRKMVTFIEEAKSDMAKMQSEMKMSPQEHLKMQMTLSEGKEALEKNLKVNKWMMVINMMVMGLTVTVLFLSVLF